MSHIARVQRIIDFVEANLRRELSLRELAQRAGYSMWHFQKIFSATTGESLAEYIRGRRLTAALARLIDDEVSAAGLAKQYGFGSTAAFSRAFSKRFKLNPSQAKKHLPSRSLVRAKPKITVEYLRQIFKGVTMEPKIIEQEEKLMVGYQTSFVSALSPETNNMQVLPKLWQRFNADKHKILNRLPQQDFGVCDALTPEERLRASKADDSSYMACSEVSNSSEVPQGMCLRRIPAGRFAVFIHRGSMENIEHTFRYIYGAWLPASGMELRDSPCLEVYGSEFVPNAVESEMKILVPVK